MIDANNRLRHGQLEKVINWYSGLMNIHTKNTILNQLNDLVCL